MPPENTEGEAPATLPLADVKAKVQALLTKLKSLVEERKNLSLYLTTPHDSDDEEVSGLKQQISDLNETIQEAQDELKETQERLLEVLSEAVEEEKSLTTMISEIQGKVRALLLSEDFESRKNGLAVTIEGGFGVRRNKTSKTVVSYDSLTILEKFPDLANVEFEGSPLFPRTISPELADRMIAAGVLSADLKQYRTEVFAKSPGIEFLEGGE
jgi:flagellar biosynthesis chaperone FliJ